MGFERVKAVCRTFMKLSSGIRSGASKKHSKSRQKICQKSTLPYTQHTWLIIRKKHFLKHILEPVLLLSWNRSKTGLVESKNPVFGSKSSVISEIVLFRTFQKLRQNDVKLELRKLQKTRSNSKTNLKVRFKVRNAGPYLINLL